MRWQTLVTLAFGIALLLTPALAAARGSAP